MREFDIIILNHLIDRYENSTYFKKGLTSRPRGIYLTISKLFPNYGSSNCYVETEKIDEVVSELFKRKFILPARKNEFGNREVSLNTDQEIISRIYDYLKRDRKKDCRDIIIAEIKRIQTDTFIDDFIEYIYKAILRYESLFPYVENDSLNNFIEVLDILKLMVEQKQEISFRKFSILVFHESKKLELYKKKIFNIIKDFYDESIENEYEAFECFNIFRNPSHVYVKGNMVITINNQYIDLNNFNHSFVFLSKDIEELEVLNIKAKKVITVENLTSFYDLNVDDALILYLGGYHNSLNRRFLLHIYNILKEKVDYYHFGDIDAGGFYIFLDLINKTQIPFKTYKMDIDTLKLYRGYTLPLTTNDIKRLIKLKECYHNPVIDYMLEHKIKLEQEIID